MRALAALLAPILLAQAPVPGQKVAMPSWWVPNAGSGWIPLARDKDYPQLVIPVTINGEPGWALVDTGFEGMFLSKRFADAHNLALLPYTSANSFGGATAYSFAAGISMAIGDVHTQAPATFAVADLDQLAAMNAHPIDAVIGTGVLGHMAWEVDEDAGRLRFLPTGALAMAHPAPVHPGPDGARLVTDVDLGPASKVLAAIDTGSDDDLDLTPDLARQARVTILTDIAAAGAGGMVVDQLGRVPAATVGGAPNAALPVVIGDELPRVMNEPAVIGMGLLKRYNLRVDLPAGQFELQPRTTPVAPERKATVGAQGPFADGRKTIVHVMLNSPAAAAGLKAGDAICAVNGQPMTQALFNSGWGSASPGTRFMLGLCDGRSVSLVARAFY